MRGGKREAEGFPMAGVQAPAAASQGRGHATGSFTRLLRNERGTSILELAIAAPVLLLLFVGVADLGDGFTKRIALQQAVSRAIESAQNGPMEGTYNYIVSEAAEAAQVPEGNVMLEQWLECNGVKKKPEETCKTGEAAVRYIKLEVWKSYTPMFGRSGYTTVDGDGLATIRASYHLRVPN